jgi:hypothetical protein
MTPPNKALELTGLRPSERDSILAACIERPCNSVSGRGS